MNDVLRALLLAVSTVLAQCAAPGEDDALLADDAELTEATATGGSYLVGGLEWRQSGASNWGNQVVVGDPDQTFPSSSVFLRAPRGGAGRYVRIGFSDLGGGYIDQVRLVGFGADAPTTNLAVPRYGKGWQGAIRDAYHRNLYNPAQAGFRDHFGAPVDVLALPGSVLVPQFAMSLYGDPGYDFLANEQPLGPNWLEDSERDDGGVQDADLVSGEASVNAELRSEFDFSATSADVTTAVGVPAVEHREYYAFVRGPGPAKQFYLGDPVYEGLPVLDVAALVRDVSPRTPADQTPAPRDMSNVTQTQMGIRLYADEFPAFRVRRPSGWDCTLLGSATRTSLFEGYVATPGHTFVDMNGDPIANRRGWANPLEAPAIIMSTSCDEDATSVALFAPSDDPMNAEQIRVVERATLREVLAEDRRLRATFFVSAAITPEGRRYFFVGSRNFLAGFLSPPSATAARGGIPHFEVLTNKTLFLFGTGVELENEIAAAAP